MIKFTKNNFANIISLIAISISFWGASSAHEANKIALEIRKLKQDIVFYSKSVDANKTVVMVPYDSNQVIIKTEVIFAHPFGVKGLSFTSRNPELNMGVIKEKIRNLVDNETFMNMEEYKKYGKSFIIPIVINTKYLSDNKSLENSSLYNISFRAKITNSSTDVEIESIYFVQKLNEEINPINFLNTMWGMAIINRKF